jgi:hypothetical protein
MSSTDDKNGRLHPRSNDTPEDGDRRPTKRLRSSDTDLTIIVGEGEHKKTYDYHSQIMAMHSRYVDAMLATPMKEKHSMTITFPEIDPVDWECMMAYLQPAAPPPKTTAQIVRVLPWYDKYEFQDGFRMCDSILSRLDFKVESVGNLAEYVRGAGAAYRHNLPETKAKCRTFCRELLRKREARLGLTQENICDFVPVLHEERAVFQKVLGLIGPMAGNPDKDSLLANPFFPDLLLRAILSTDYEYNLEKKVTAIRVRNSGWPSVNGNYDRATDANGGFVYKKDNKASPFTEEFYVAKKAATLTPENSAIWVLYQRELQNPEVPNVFLNKILFSSKAHPLSVLPPRGGWRPYRQGMTQAPPIIKFD